MASQNTSDRYDYIALGKNKWMVIRRVHGDKDGWRKMFDVDSKDAAKQLVHTLNIGAEHAD